jgi:hypothetical protein
MSGGHPVLVVGIVDAAELDVAVPQFQFSDVHALVAMSEVPTGSVHD